MKLPLGRLTFSRAKAAAAAAAAAAAPDAPQGLPYHILAYDAIAFPQQPWFGAAGPSDPAVRAALKREAANINNRLRNEPPAPTAPAVRPPDVTPGATPGATPVATPGATPAPAAPAIGQQVPWQGTPDASTPVFDRRGTLAWARRNPSLPASPASPASPTSPGGTGAPAPVPPVPPGSPGSDTSLAQLTRSVGSRGSGGGGSRQSSPGATMDAGEPDSDPDSWNAFHAWQTPPWVRSPVRMLESPYDTAAAGGGGGVAAQQQRRLPAPLLLFSLEYFLKAEQRASTLRMSIMRTRNGAARALLKPQLDNELMLAQKKLRELERNVTRLNYIWLKNNHSDVNDSLLKIYQSYYRVMGGSGTEVRAIDEIGNPVHSLRG